MSNQTAFVLYNFNNFFGLLERDINMDEKKSIAKRGKNSKKIPQFCK